VLAAGCAAELDDDVWLPALEDDVVALDEPVVWAAPADPGMVAAATPANTARADAEAPARTRVTRLRRRRAPSRSWGEIGLLDSICRQRSDSDLQRP
jgi:hypothetical protein